MTILSFINPGDELKKLGVNYMQIEIFGASPIYKATFEAPVSIEESVKLALVRSTWVRGYNFGNEKEMVKNG
jgi:hypothetical protein